MSQLLGPVHIGSRTSKNRIIFGPHETNLARQRSLSERHVSYYERRAEGGAGIVVTEEASVHVSDWPYERAPLAEHCAGGWEEISAACHRHGTLVIASIGHSGGQGTSAYSQLPLWAPSRMPEVNSREVPKSMEPAEIFEVTSGFVAAARVAIDSNIDGIEVNAGQHSLLRQFLSGLTNHREDAWGTDKALFLRQVIQGIRDEVKEAILGLRLSCDEMAPWAGIIPEQGASIAVEISELVDYITVVRGSIYTVSATRPDCHVAPGFNLELASSIRQAVGGATLISAQGSIVDQSMAEGAVTEGSADLVEMTRALIADPDLPRKVASGNAERVRPCVLCNQACQVRDNRNPIVNCIGEPSAGYETKDDAIDEMSTISMEQPSSPTTGHSLLVVGGGPAGLECARVAALSGMRVALHESSEYLGGTVRLAALGAGRGHLARLVDWLESECRLLGVEINTSSEVDEKLIADHEGPIVVCTGSKTGQLTFTLAEKATVIGPEEALRELSVRAARDPDARTPSAAEGSVGVGPIVVWDPIGGPIAVSVAELARTSGIEVTIATPDFVVGQELARTGDLAPANTRLQSSGVELLKKVFLRSVTTADGSLPLKAIFEDRYTGEEVSITATAVIDCGHRLPDDELWRQSGSVALRAGDCVAPRQILQAVLEGRRCAQAVIGCGSR